MDAQARLRELVALQLGDQLVALCEKTAQLEAQAAEIVTLKAVIETLKAPETP